MLIIATILFAVGLFISITSTACFANAKKWSDDTYSVDDFKKVGIKCAIIALILIISSIEFFAIGGGFEILAESNSNSSQHSAPKEKCAMCGDMVSKDDMRGSWCKDYQNDAFGDDGWYDKIKD